MWLRVQTLEPDKVKIPALHFSKYVILNKASNHSVSSFIKLG